MNLSGRTMLLGLAVGSFFLPAYAETPSAPGGLSVVLQETDSCKRWKETLDFVESVPAKNLPDLVEQVRLGHGPGREMALDFLIGRWVKLDPQGALTAARKMGPNDVAAEIFSELYGDELTRNRAATIAKLRAMPESLERTLGLWGVMQKITPDDPALAAELFSSIHTYNFAYGNQVIYSHWAEKDLKAATASLLAPARFPNDLRRSNAVDGVVDYLMSVKASSALTWLRGLPDGPIHDLAVARLVDRWVRTDPAEAMAWLQIPGVIGKDIATGPAIDQWANQDPQGAMAYAATLDAGPVKSGLMEKGVASWALADGPAAWAWAQKQPVGEPRIREMLNVVTHWAQNDPAIAAAKLEEIPEAQETAEEKERRENSRMMNWHQSPLFERPPSEQAYGDVAATWAKIDPAQVATWLAKLPEGPHRDAVIESYSEVLVKTNPAQAVKLASTIGAADARRVQLNDLMMRWVRVDRKAAGAAVEGLPLPDQDKAWMRKATQ